MNDVITLIKENHEQDELNQDVSTESKKKCFVLFAPQIEESGEMLVFLA